MEEESINKEKLSQEHWDADWKAEGFVQRLTRHKSFRYLAVNNKMMMLFKKHLAPGDEKLLDIGCGTGKWLVYFQREFGYGVYGVDYSEKGCAVARETLGRNKVKGEIICADACDTSFQNRYEEYFDVVVSMGVAEHFSDPTEAISMHLKLLKRGGKLIIAIPNYSNNSLYGKAQKLFGHEEELLKGHNVALMKIPTFREYLEQFENLEIETLDYVGPPSVIGIIPWRFGLQYVFYPLNELVGYATFFLSSEILSPMIVLVAKKIKGSLA